eukprot:955747-Pleurochrysis_carterae.AAC.1
MERKIRKTTKAAAQEECGGKGNICANPKRGDVRHGKQMCESKKRCCAARDTDVRIQKKGDVRQGKQSN